MAIKSVGLISVLLTFVTVFLLAARVNGQGMDGDARLPIEFSDIWLIYDMTNVAQWAAMTLNDGTLTTSINDVMTSSVAESKRQTSTSWATFSHSQFSGQLVAKFPDWKAARPYYISDKSIVIGNTFLLQGCFGLGGITQKHDRENTLPDTYVEPAALCFSPTYGFMTKGLQLDQSGQMFEASKSVDVQYGQYFIEGNLITFEYAEGSRMSTVLGAYRFGQQAPALSAISIGEHIFFKLPFGEFVYSRVSSNPELRGLRG